MAEFFFDLQRFVTVTDGQVTLTKDDIDFTVDGVNYVPNVNGAVLKAETTDNGDGTYTATAITGITSGSVTAFPAGSSTDPGISFVDTNGEFDFTCTGDDGAINVKYRNSSINYTSGNLTYTASDLMMPPGKLGITGTLANIFPYNVELTVPSDGATLKFDGQSGATFTASEAVGAKLTFDENIAPLLAALDKSVLVALAAAAGITLTEEQVESTLKIAIPFFQSGLSLDLTGEITYNTEEKTVLFAKDTTTNLYFGERTISFTTNADAGTTFAYEDGALTITPNDGDGSLDVTIKNGDTTAFAANVEISGGSFVFDVTGSKVSVTAGTTMTISAPGISFGKRSFVVTADDETGFDLELDETGNKLTLTSADENPLTIKITNGSATTFEREITFTGSVVIGMDDNSFTVTQGTALTFYNEVGDTEYTTTITATSEAGIGLELVDGKFTITPGEDDGSLNLIHQRGDTTVFDLDLSVSGGSMTIDPSSGAFTVAEGTTLEITDNQNDTVTSITVEDADANFNFVPGNDGIIQVSFEGGDGKLHVVHTNSDGITVFDNVVELSGTLTFDAENNTLTVADGTTLSIDFGESRNITVAVKGDANLTINADSSKIAFKPGENDGSLAFKVTNGDTTIFDGNLSITGGGFSFDMSTQTLEVDAGTVTTFDLGQGRTFTFSLPNGATDNIYIDDDGKINFTPLDSDPFSIKFANGDTTIFEADVTLEGTVSYNPSTNLLSIDEGTTTTIALANGRTIELTATDEAGVTFAIDDEGKITITPGEDDGKIHFAITEGDTVREFDVELTGAIVFDATNQKIYAEAGTTLSISNNQVDIVTEISVDDDAGFTFTLDSESGKVTITPEDGDGKLTFTRIRDGGERMFSADIEVSGGSIIFDSSNNSLTITEGTTTAITAGDYTVELTVTDEAGVTINVSDDGKLVVSAEEGDGELAFTLKKGDTVLNSGSVEFVGSLELDPNNQTVGVTKDTSATFTLGSYEYSITANADASIALSEDTGAITITAPDGDGSLDLKLTKGDATVFAGNVEFTGSFTVDPVNQKISLSDDSQTKITVGIYTVALAVTDEASVGFTLGDGTITLTAEEGDGKATVDITRSGSSVLSGEVEFDGEITLDVANQEISVTEGTSITLTRDEVTTTITATDDAGFTIANDGGKLTLTPGDGDGKLQITRTQGDDTFTAELEVNGSIVLDTANNALSLTKGTTTTVTVGEYTVEATTTDDAGVNITIDGNKVTLTPQDGDGSIHVEVTSGDDLIFENTIGISNGSASFDFENQQITIPAGTTLVLEQGDQNAEVYFTAQNDIAINVIRNENNVNYFQLVDDVVSNITVVRDGNTIFSGISTISGTFSYRADTRTFGIIGTDNPYVEKESSFTLSVGDSTVYTFKAETDGETVVTAFDFDDKGNIILNYPREDYNSLVISAAKDGEEIFKGEISVDGSIVYNTISNAVTLPADTTISVTQGDFSAIINATDDAGFTIDADSGKITITPGDGDGKLNTVIYNGDTPVFGGTVEISGGSIVYDALNHAISVTKGTTTTVTIDERSIALTANDDAGVSIGLGEDGKLILTPEDGDGSIDVTYSVDGQVAFANNIEISGGSITVDALTNSVGLTKGTTITLSNFSGTDGDSVSVTALDDASIAISAVDGGIRVAPDSGDGDLQLSVTRDSVTRTATIGIEGAIVYQRGGNISLEEGTTIDLVWEDGYELAIISNGSTGSIAFDAEKGLGITSADDKLDLKLTNPSGVEFTLGGIQGTLWYNSGKALVEEGSTLTTTWTGPAGVDIDVKVSAVDDDAYIKFDSAGMTFASDEGTAEVSFTVSGIENTMSVTGGSITFERTTTSINFVIAEGTTLTTNLVSGFALPFTTTDAGEYTINEHKLTTSTEGVQFYATSNGIVLAASEDVICDGMTFTGGNVTLTADGGHVLGAGVSVADFDPDDSIVLTEAGTVTVDGKTFELIKDAPLGVTITGAEDGYIIGSRESEDSSPFIEKFAAAGDSIYRVQASSEGLENVIDISAPVTINGGATEDGKSIVHYFNVVTATDGDFTIGERAYNIAGDSLVTLETNFDGDEGYISGADGLEGTIRGDFTASPVTVNGGESIIVHGDTDISIAVNENGLEIFNVSDGATLETYAGVSKAHTDGAGDFVLGVEADDSLLIRTDDAATFEFDDEEYVTVINGIGLKFVNASEVILDSVSAYDDMIFVHGAENAILETDKPEKVWMQMTGESMTVNDNELKLAGDKDGIWFSNKEIVGLDEGASLTVGEAGTYSTDVVSLEAQAGDVIVGLGGDDAYIYDENNPLITKQSTTEELVARFNPDETFVVGSESRGRINLELDGNDLAIVEDTPAWVNIDADGDTIVSQGQHVNVNLGDGNTWLFPLDGNMTLEGYDHSTDTGFGTNYTDIATAIENGSIQLGDGKITLGSAKVDMGGNDLINFYNRDGELQKVGYVAEGDVLDASDETSDLLLFAENYSTIASGSGDDTIKAGAGAIIDAGAGDNFIELTPEDERYERDKGAVVDSNDGDNTVENFKAGFDYESDAVAVETSGLSCFFDGADITVKTADGDTTVLEDVADGSDFAQIKVVDGTTYNAAIAQEGEFIDVTDDKTDIYIGENSGVDFSGYSGQVLIDLDDKRGTVGKTDAQFFGINQLIGGDGITTLIGSSGDETITAGTGRASIWGNWGNDLMIGNTSADKKAGTEFFMFADDGHDTIDHFEFLTAQNSLTADRIFVGTSDINSATLNGDDVVINFDGSSDLTLTDAAGKNIQISDMIAKVDTDVEFDGIANTYIATDSNAELTVADSVGSAEIWLNNSHDAKFYGDIRTIDASNVSGKTTLGGNDSDNTIIAGQGDASLWGSGGNDWLVGGDGHNTFFYLLGNGNDTITGTNTDDELALSDITLDQISETSVTENGASIKFTDGGSLTINGTADVTAVLADGTHYTANHAQKEWVAK